MGHTDRLRPECADGAQALGHGAPIPYQATPLNRFTRRRHHSSQHHWGPLITGLEPDTRDQTGSSQGPSEEAIFPALPEDSDVKGPQQSILVPHLEVTSKTQTELPTFEVQITEAW